METFVVKTDECGRDTPVCLPLSALENREDIEDMMAEYPDAEAWFVGEYGYRLATE